MKNITLIIYCLILCLSCVQTTKNIDPSNNNSILICGVKEPVKELPWLSKEVILVFEGEPNSLKTNGVVAYEYKTEQIIEIQCSLCSSLNIHQYRCDGSIVDFLNLSDYNNYIKNRKELRVLYGTKIWNF